MNKIKILFLELTQFCNLQCVFCDNRNLKRKKVLNFDDIKGFEKMIDSVEGDHIHSYIDISGYGEVMTHPEFPKFIKYFKEKGKNVRVSTNGILIDKYFDDLIDSTVINLTISLNSLNNETYKKLMGKNGLKRVLSYYWTNQQSARLMFYHDHAWGITRLVRFSCCLYRFNTYVKRYVYR